MSESTPQSDKEVIFMDGFVLGVGTYECLDGRIYLGIVMEDIDKRYFLPFWENPNDHIKKKFKKALKEFDFKYSNIGLRE